jgi:Leucine-rich repeat (LRR) protein
MTDNFEQIITESESFEYVMENTKKTLLYTNDFKYMNKKSIDMNQFANNQIKNMDTIEYRMMECNDNDNKLLDLSNMDLKELPLNIPLSIEYLFLSDNDLVDVDLRQFKNLKIVDLSSNKFKILPHLPESVEEISCRDNEQLVDLSKLLHLAHLKRLDVSYCNLREIPIIDTLEMLVCASNKITSIGNYKSLIRLDCRKNRITNISIMNSLMILECDHNCMESIKDFLNLKSLYCCNNKINDIANLNRIEIIHCTNNDINKLFYFNTLREIICDSEKLRQFSKNYVINRSQKNHIDKIRYIQFV